MSLLLKIEHLGDYSSFNSLLTHIRRPKEDGGMRRAEQESKEGLITTALDGPKTTSSPLCGRRSGREMRW